MSTEMANQTKAVFPLRSATAGLTRWGSTVFVTRLASWYVRGARETVCERSLVADTTAARPNDGGPRLSE
jgi:hypothetical protein